MPHQDPASYRPGTTLPTLSSPAEIEQATEALAQALAATAVERDRAGGHAAAERELIRASGLLDLTTPRAYGGWGQSWQTFYASLRRIAQADSSLAHLYAFHHLQVATILLYGKPEQHEFFLRHTVEQRLFWGNALNPNDKRALAIEDGAGWRISGPKSYCSGSVGSDSLTFSAWHEPSQSLLIGALPSDRAGLSIRADWDAFGQKQTDSGTVIFDQVRLQAHEVLVRPAEVLADLAAQRSTRRWHSATPSRPPTAAGWRSRSPGPRRSRTAPRSRSAARSSSSRALARPRRASGSTASGAMRGCTRCTTRSTTSCATSAAMR